MKRMYLATALTSLAVTSGSFAQSSPVYPGGAIDFTEGSTKSVVTDVNRDGVTDIVALVINEFGLTSQVALGTGAGTFEVLTPITLLPFANQVGDFDAADVNGDGLPDLVGLMPAQSAGVPSDILVALNVGNGAFNVVLSLPLSMTTGVASNLEIADVDVDGVPDAVFSAGDEAYVLRGRGDGVFEPEVLVASAASGTVINAIAAGDLNADGLPDLVISQESPGKLLILRGLGDGSFVQADEREALEPSGLALADLDDDGDLDIAVASLAPGETTVIPGTGDLTFGASIAVDTMQPTIGIVAGDYDNDGVVDLVAMNPLVSAVNVMRGLGGGQFATFKFDTIPGGVRSVTPTRLNGDLATDWVFTNASQDIGIVFALGRSGQLSQFPIVDNEGSSVHSLTLADMNGDGADDRVYIRQFVGVFVSLWEGDGYGDQLYLGPIAQLQDFTVADLDGDGTRDIVVGERLSSIVRVYKGLGDGTFNALPGLDVGIAGRTRGLTSGDLDFDGDDEIVYSIEAEAGDAIVVLDSDASGKLSIVETLADVNSEGETAELELHDVDHDGALDLLNLSSERRFEIRRGIAGTTQFMPADQLILPLNQSAPVDFLVGRFESIAGDTVDDLVFIRGDGFRGYAGRAAPSGDMAFILGANFSYPAQTFATGAVIDRDGDDVLELVLPDPARSVVLVLQHLVGSGLTLDFEVVERLPISALLVAVGRVDDDAFDDIVTFANTGRVALRQSNLPWDAIGGATAPVTEDLPSFLASGDPSPGSSVRLEYSDGIFGVQPILVVGISPVFPGIPLQGGMLIPSPDILIPLPFTDGFGDLGLDLTWSNFPPGIRLWTQVWQVAGPDTRASNALTVESR